MKLSWLLVLTVVALLLAPSLPAQNTAGDKANPPANFKKVSTLVRLPDWLPGWGRCTLILPRCRQALIWATTTMVSWSMSPTCFQARSLTSTRIGMTWAKRLRTWT